jgi:hypothetical protein
MQCVESLYAPYRFFSLNFVRRIVLSKNDPIAELSERIIVRTKNYMLGELSGRRIIQSKNRPCNELCVEKLSAFLEKKFWAKNHPAKNCLAKNCPDEKISRRKCVREENCPVEELSDA